MLLRFTHLSCHCSEVQAGIELQTWNTIFPWNKMTRPSNRAPAKFENCWCFLGYPNLILFEILYYCKKILHYGLFCCFFFKIWSCLFSITVLVNFKFWIQLLIVCFKSSVNGLKSFTIIWMFVFHKELCKKYFKKINIFFTVFQYCVS